MTFDKFFKLFADLTAGRDISEDDDRELVKQMLKLSENRSSEMALVNYAKLIARGEE